MKVFFWLTFNFLITPHLIAQLPFGFVKSELIKNVLEKDDDFILTITFKSLTKEELYVTSNPLITEFKSDFGQIQLKLEKVSGSCFREFILDTHMPFGDIKRPVLKLNYNDSIVHKIDIRETFPLSYGYYRLQVCYKFSTLRKTFYEQSKLIYFFIPTNENSDPKPSENYKPVIQYKQKVP